MKIPLLEPGYGLQDVTLFTKRVHITHTQSKVSRRRIDCGLSCIIAGGLVYSVQVP